MPAPIAKPYALVKLYNQCKIIETENYIVDLIETYLATLTSYEFNCQYIRHGLDIKVRVNLDAWTYNNCADRFNVNYAYIESRDPTSQNAGYGAYYFVRSIVEIAQSAVELSLHMDVINTFKDRQGFMISKRTIIRRQHKIRYVKNEVDGIWHTRKIDFYPEGINPPLYREMSYYQVEDPTSEYAKDYYLIYKNSRIDSADINNVVNCFLATKEGYQATIHQTGSIITPQLLIDKGYKYYYITRVLGGSNISFVDDITGNTITFTETTNQMIKFLPLEGNKILVTLYGYNDNLPSTAPARTNIYITNSITYAIGGNVYYSDNDMNTRSATYIGAPYFDLTASDIVVTTKAYRDIDKTDSRIIKIIKIPYAPTGGFSVVSNVMSYDTTKWNYNEEENLLQLKQNVEFINNDLVAPDLGGDYYYLQTLPDVSVTDLRNDYYEPKMLHSEFYQRKFLYDSFSTNIDYEKIDDLYSTNSYVFKISFKMTQTINSRFMFDLSRYSLDISSQDFPYSLVVQRNNEEVIYNSAYINYLRAGYNYDVKAKNRQEVMTWATTGIQLGAGLLSVIGGSKVLGVSMIASSILSLGNAINSTLSAEQNLEAKVHALKWQAASVYGADDVDLMSYYAKNKLLVHTYKPSKTMDKLIRDLFFLTGYNDNTMGIPEVTSRSWFNFLACDLKFSSVSKTIPADCLQEIVNKYASGVTFMHTHTVNNHWTWDWDRKYQNWESIMFI